MKPEEIKEIRTNLKLTQTEFGERIGVSLRSVINYEKGDSNPHGGTLEKIMALAGYAVSESALEWNVQKKLSEYDPLAILLYIEENENIFTPLEEFQRFLKRMWKQEFYSGEVMEEIEKLKLQMSKLNKSMGNNGVE